MNIKINTFVRVAAIAVSVAVSGCVSAGPREEYFGYNNSPRHAEPPPPEDRSAAWRNPFRQSPPPPERIDYDDPPTDYRSYGYVPVVVPWWDGCYGWPGFSRPRVSVRLYYGCRPAFYPWYSPWYDYNPFYGGVCRNWGYSSWHRPWHYDSWRHLPPPPPRPPERRGTRNFGPQSGTGAPANGGGVITSGSRTRTPVRQGIDSPPDNTSARQSGSGAVNSPFGTSDFSTKNPVSSPEAVRAPRSERPRESVKSSGESRPSAKPQGSVSTTNQRKRNP